MRFNTIGDARMIQKTLARDAPLDELLARSIEAGVLFKAEALDQLAGLLGFEGDSKENFLDEAERYNGFYDAQLDEDFGKVAYRLSSLTQPPYYGIWYGGMWLATEDGLEINEKMQVLDETTRPIEGLYAAGDCSGSLFAGGYAWYISGCAVGRSITFGRHVAKLMAGEV
jgi:hypothetical protein